MNLISRVKSILLSPKTEWPVIAAEPATIKGLYVGYIMILAAIPAVFGFIKGSLIGTSAFGITVTTPIMIGLVGMIVGYVLGLILLFVIAWIVNALASSFGGQKNQVQALKAVGYAWTAAWVAGIAVIIPWIGWLIGLAGAVYSIYLLYLGLPHTMKCPPEKSAGYTAVSVIIAIVLSVILGFIVAAVTGLGAMTSAAITGSSSSTANVTFEEDSQLGELAALGEKLRAAGEQAQENANDAGQQDAGDAANDNSGDQASGALGALGALMAMGQGAQDSSGSDSQAPADQGAQAQQALGAMMAAMGGSKDGKAVASLSSDQLKSFLPESLGGFQRTSLSASRNAAMGMQVTEASADYASADGSQQVSIDLTDMPSMGGMMAMASAFGGAGDSETQSADGYEKTYTLDGHRIHEKWNKNRKYGEYSISVGNRFQIEAAGNVDSMDQLKGLVGSLDLVGLAALKDGGSSQQ